MDESGAATTSRFTRRDELATTSEYRALSLWALASLAVGLLSLFAFLSPLFWLLPLAGVAVGTMTLRQLHLNRDRFTGSRLAWCGLAISLVTLGWAPARQITRMSALEGKARQVADAFVDLICQAKLHEAHQWHLHASDRAPLDAELKTYYASDSHKERLLNDFFASPVMKQWLALGTASQARFVKVSSSFAFTNQEEILFEYEVTGQVDGHTKTLQAIVVVAREKVEGANRHELFVSAVVDLDPFLRKNP